MKKLLFISLVLISLNAFSQINFEKGYFVENSGKKVTCLIKNVDWYNNPKEFKYKLSKNSKINIARINTVKEFGIDNYSKFIKSTIGIDRSSNRIEELSESKKANLKKETLFLKVLVEGSAILYHYRESHLERFFFKKGENPIEQLIYKKFTQNGFIGENNLFRTQLSNQLKCEVISQKSINRLKYQKKKLIDFFISYSQCIDKDYVKKVKFQKPNEKTYSFNLNIRPRFNYFTLQAATSITSRISIPGTLIGNRGITYIEDIRFNTESQSIGFGLEIELILPFNKNKWAVTIEPTYSSFKKEISGEYSSNNGVTINTKSNFSFLNVPVGLRHYLFLKGNANSKLFLNTSLSFNFYQKAIISYSRINNAKIGESKFSRRKHNYNFGIGYKYKDKYSIELRYTPNQFSENSLDESLEMSLASIILGYTLF